MGNIGVNSTPKTYKSWANGYRALVETSFKKGKDYRQGVFHLDTTENFEDRMVEIGGMDDFQRWDDGERAAQTSIREGYQQTFTQVPFGLELPIGRLMKKFQGANVNITRRGAKGLGARAYRVEQRAPFSVLSYGIQSNTNAYLTGLTGSSVSTLTPDGRRLFSSLHRLSPDDATTWSNVLTDNAAVSEAALEAHIVNVHNQPDDKGQKLHYGAEGYIWLVTLEDFFEASRICGSKDRAGTGDNDTNVFYGNFDGRPIEVRWVPFLSDFGSTRNHFLVAKDAVEEQMPVTVLTSEKFYTDDYIDDATATAYVRGRMIFSVGAVTGRGLSGSLGTGTGTYTD